MKVNLKYFGFIAESTGTSQEVFQLEDETSVSELKKQIIERYQLEDTEAIQIAVNQNLNATADLKDGDEIAFLPPFAGG